MSFKPDYGMRMMSDGISQDVDLWFYDFHIFSVNVLGRGAYSTCSNTYYEGELHALSLDFNQTQMEQILSKADHHVSEFVRAELANDPESSRWIDLDEAILFTVRARLGRLQTAEKEQFVPLVAQAIL